MKKKRLRLKALVLAAGKGERLRPLTRSLPKPLLPVAGKPVTAYTLARLAALGCEATALNLHHRGEQIEDHFGSSVGNMPLVYSREKELLGTLGAFGPLQEFFRDVDLILLINGDSLCRWPLKRMLRHHQTTAADATMLLSERADPAEFGGGVGVDEKGRVIHLGDRTGDSREAEPVARRYVFAGAHVLSPLLLKDLAGGPDAGGLPVDGPLDLIKDLYVPLLQRGGRVESVVTKGHWHDLGTPRHYLIGAFDWARGRLPRRLWRRNWVSKLARVESGARLRNCVVEGEARIEPWAKVEQSLILSGAIIGRGSRLTECIVATGVSLPSETWVERRLITPLKSGRALTGNDSVVGQVVYTPID